MTNIDNDKKSYVVRKPMWEVRLAPMKGPRAEPIPTDVARDAADRSFILLFSNPRCTTVEVISSGIEGTNTVA